MPKTQEDQVDKKFYERADAHIALANGHVNEKIHPGLASNSLMYAASRFNAWVTAASFKSAKDMQKEKREILDFYTNQYRLMLEENFDNYVEYYDQYIGGSQEMTQKKK